MTELSDNDLDMYDVPEILKNGFEVRKREKNIIERGIQRGNKIMNVVVVDMGTWYKLIHAGKFTSSGKFRKLARDENGI